MASVTFEQSIDHSADTLNTLNQFTKFMDCIETVADIRNAAILGAVGDYHPFLKSI